MSGSLAPPPRTGGAPHPLSAFSKRSAGPPGAPSPSSTDPLAARRSTLLSAYSRYANPVSCATVPPPAIAVSDSAPPPGSVARSAQLPPAQPLMGSYATEAMRRNPSSPTTQLSFAQLSGSPSNPPHAAHPRAAALDAPLATSPQPPSSTTAAGGPRIGGGSRYLVPHYAFGGETHPSFGGPPPPVAQPSAPSSASPPPPPPPAPPRGATRFFMEHTETGVQQERVLPSVPSLATEASPLPSPALFSSPPDPATAPVGPPLATRVSCAALARPGGSSTSSNGRQPRRDSSEVASQWAPTYSSKELRAFFGEANSLDETTTAAVAAHHSRPSSRGSSTPEGCAAASAAALEAGGRRTPSGAGQPPNSGSGLRRSVPTFLQPSGGDRVAQRPLRAASSAVNSAATVSRGRQLLEAALTSRGIRRMPLRNTPFDSLSAHSQRQLSASLKKSQGTPISDTEADAAVAELKAEGCSEVRDQLITSVANKSSDNDRSAVIGTPLLSQELVTLRNGLVSTGAGESVLSRNVHQLMGGNEESLTWDAALPLNEQEGDSKDLSVWHNSLQQAGAPPRKPDATRGDHGSRADAASVDTHSSAPPGNRNFHIGGGAAAPGAEVYALVNTLTPCFSASGPLPTSAIELSQNVLNAEGTSADASDSAVAAVAHVNPFCTMTRESGGGSAAALPPQQHYTRYSGLQRGAPPSSSYSASAGKVSRVPLSCYPSVDSSAREKPLNPKVISTAEGTGEAKLPLPPLPQQQHQQPLSAPGGGDTTPATGPATGFTTPRGGGAGSIPEAQQKPQHPLPPSRPSSSHAPSGVGRGSYAASPYVRDDDARAVDGESPMPLRPPSFDSVPRLEGTQREAVEQGDVEIGAIDAGVHNCTDSDDDGDAVRYSMWDGPSDGDGAAGQPLPQSQPDQCAEPPHWWVPNAGAANPFSTIDTRAQPKQPHEVQQQSPPLPAEQPQEQEQRQEAPVDQSFHRELQPSALPPQRLSMRAIYDSSASRPHPGQASRRNQKLSEGSFSTGNPTEPLQRVTELQPSPHNAADTSSYHDYPSVSNPFLEPDENPLFTTLSVPLPDGANATANSGVVRKPHQTLGSSLVSVRLAQAQQESPQYAEQLRSPNHLSTSSLEPSGPLPLSKGSPAPPVSVLDSITALSPRLAGGDGAPGAASAPSDPAGVTTGTAAARTPGGTTLVNPFSKSAPNPNCYSSAASVSINCGCALSGGTSLTSSFAGVAGRKKSRRSVAPCFAIFVGGAILPPGLQSGNSRDRRGFPCIAVCFSLSSRSPVVTNSGWSPSGQPIPSASSRSASVRATSLSGSNRANTSPVPRPLGTGTLGGSIGSCVSFCSVKEALTARGSVVDRKGIRGTEYGRRYVRALTDAVLPCALHADKWEAGDQATGTEVAKVMEALKGCILAPLGDVVEVMLMDVLPQKAEDGFVWKNNGGRRLAELLTQAAEAEVRRLESTTSSRGPTANVAAAAGGTSTTRSSDALVPISPLNLATSAVAYDLKERSSALRRVEDLLCTGQRVEAVEAALAAHLHVHALLISMMCPTKDLYLRSVQAVMQHELLVTSPLAHAYSMFNEMPLPPFVLSPPRAGEEGGEEAPASEQRGASEAAQHPRQMFLRDQATLQRTWRRHAAVLLANFTRHSGGGLLQLAATLQQFHLVVEAHTCLLLLHLTPLGMAGPARAGAEPLPPASSLSPEDVENLLPRSDQRQVMEEIRRRIGIVGGTYHPTQGCRASFLTPVKTVLTQLVQLVSARLDARAPPLSLPESAEPPVLFHGLPHGQPRDDVGYRMMQVLWLRELGLGTEAGQALHALLQRMAPPLAFSLRAPPRTLNELVYLFGGVPPPSRQPPPDAADSTTAAARGESAPESEATTQQPSPSTSSGLPSHSREGLPQDTGNAAAEIPSTNMLPPMPATTEENHLAGLPLPLNPQQSSPGTQQHPLSLDRASPPSTSPGTAAAPLTRDQGAAALQPPERSAPSQIPSTHQLQAQRQPLLPPQRATPTTASKAGKSRQPAPRRSRSLDALRNFFFRRGNSKAASEEKAEEAKPMHLDTEKPPAFDPVTGRWLFEETEEEKRLRELAKAGPPKMAPKAAAPTASTTAAGPTSAPAAEAAASSPTLLGAALPRQPAADAARRPGLACPGPGAPALAHAGGGMPAPRPAGGTPAIVGRNVIPSTMAGRGAARPGGRPQYVDMFNSIN
ncbi:hypothetical protein CUR178_04188 [Leishmania enriettii]|uniref:Sec16 Sec23-binding domain-containing protein n=1 Tax=Leishmania enriettii TaxID=5663 RepID=A0A836GUB2_LEIEN|nr:hypothetical protein CUR178_04188 [Leishmania enriettii]